MKSLLTEIQVGGLLQVSPRTLRTWRREGRAPEFTRLGRSVRYSEEAVEAFIKAAFEAQRALEVEGRKSKGVTL